MSWYVYIIQCRDNTLYTGITTDISRRLKEHNSKKGAFYTKNKTPVKLVYQESMAGQSEARKREAAIKRLERSQKLALIKKYGLSLCVPTEGGAPASTQAYRIAWCPFVWNPIRRGAYHRRRGTRQHPSL